jgi:hypothetical protein
MIKIRKLIALSIPTLSLALLSSCAAGAATAGYALKAQSADSLTTDAEQKIVERAKREIMNELSNTNSCVTSGRTY